MGALDGRKALITGASSGIGEATAAAMAAEGAGRWSPTRPMRSAASTAWSTTPAHAARTRPYVVSQPQHVSVNEIMVRPVGE
jgi:NADP-dependent 3-hydroxy acid dehydrogenase YdfG